MTTATNLLILTICHSNAQIRHLQGSLHADKAICCFDSSFCGSDLEEFRVRIYDEGLFEFLTMSYCHLLKF